MGDVFTQIIILGLTKKWSKSVDGFFRVPLKPIILDLIKLCTSDSE